MPAAADTPVDQPPIPLWSYKILQTLPHDSRSFTQGLVVDGDQLIESSGLYGQSFIRRYDALSGRSRSQVQLPRHLFAEGLAIVDNRLFCLTWRRGIALVYDKDTLRQQTAFRYRGQGWGLATLGNRLVMSDGSEFLTLRNPSTFAVSKKLAVLRNGRPVRNLNDLTTDNRRIWANVWHQNYLVAIDPDSGAVVGELDLGKLVPTTSRKASEDVLNGIAWNSRREAMWVTGKRWPRRYLIQLRPPQSE